MMTMRFPATLLWLAFLFASSPLLAQGTRQVLVTTNGWHSGIVIARDDLPGNAIPETEDFPEAAFYEFGWGDADYYPAPRPTLGLALGTVLPGPAVLHMSGLPAHPSEVFVKVTVLRLDLDSEQFAKLVGYLADSFQRDGASRVASSAKGLYSFSAFYPATGAFHLFNTCNTWTVRALASAGLPIEASGVQTADELLRRVRPFAVAP